MLCKARRLYLLTLQVSWYCILALQISNTIIPINFRQHFQSYTKPYRQQSGIIYFSHIYTLDISLFTPTQFMHKPLFNHNWAANSYTIPTWFKSFLAHVIHICFTHYHLKLCLCIVIMGSSGDIYNGNQIQIVGFKCNGIKNHVIAAQFSCNKKRVQNIWTRYILSGRSEKRRWHGRRKWRQLLKSDVLRCCQGWDTWKLPLSYLSTGARFWYAIVINNC